MKTIGNEEYWANPEAYLLVDVRTPSEFSEAHIHSAVSQPLDDLSAERVEAQARGRQILFTCLSGARAKRAAELYGRESGVLEGSLQGWERGGYPVVRSTPKGLPLVRQVHLTVGLINILATLMAFFVHPYWAVVLLLTGAGLFVAGATGFCGLGFLFARMPWNRTAASASQLNTSCSCSR
ncbi:rhodanese-like domain-containing protein [Pelagicoccus mobilis]|uniref:Rhodanese-like domain-containing protein n=1 Tax=Pelagicoccus mobilis TaxID=415221 RepID=A0A934VRZ6_9BACT|nr:rhodanese-like domain-containing protein [Pelagicoccus mobilis]MBK1879922.1 rhodanese-like domain-containing protein [Pelagicoccus mobilis]